MSTGHTCLFFLLIAEQGGRSGGSVLQKERKASRADCFLGSALRERVH